LILTAWFESLPASKETIMPTLYKAELTEQAPATLDIWRRMHEELKPRTHEILSSLGYYAERDLAVPDPSEQPTQEELRKLEPLATALMRAAIETERMRTGTLVATLDRVAKEPSLIDSDQFPGDVLWEIARSYRRDDEPPGMFSIDVWGRDQVLAKFPSQIEAPTPSNVKRAAETALLKAHRKRGRPFNPANRVLAQELSAIFRSSDHPLARKHQDSVRHGQFVQVEAGPFHDFLDLVLTPLKDYLRERRLAPITVESIIRFATQRQKQSHPAPSPNYSHKEAL
jgi:hypothetical protein